MDLKYRGVSYNCSPSKIESVEVEQELFYRGNSYKLCLPKSDMPLKQVKFNGTFLGKKIGLVNYPVLSL